MWADLHIHSRYSDGSLTIEEILSASAERKLDCISVVDHDSTAGQRKVIEMAPNFGITAITGVEISAWYVSPKTGVGKKIHLLGYGFRLPGQNISSLCASVLAARDNMTRRQILILNELGWPVNLDEVEKEAFPATCLFKQHIMAVLLKKGRAKHLYGEVYKS
ncbi:MAG: PHP domain-containing protein, partial [Spirochaetaceae bacterium]